MYSKCYYHILKSLVPPLTGEDAYLKESLLTLEHLSACVVVGNRRNCSILSNTPAILHKMLWKAYLRDVFYANKDSTYDEKLLNGLRELLYHWPYKKFSLKEVMPTFPPKLDWYDGFPCSRNGFEQNRTKLTDFYKKVTLIIVKAFNINHNYISSDQHKNICNVKKIDITGFHDFEWRDFKLVLNNSVKLELILDASLKDGKFKEFVLQELDETGLISNFQDSPTPSSIIIKFGFVSVCARIIFGTNTQLNEKIINNGTNSIYIDCSVATKRLFENNSNLDNITGLGLTHSNSFDESLILVQYFQNLVHLNVAGNNLHGLLGCFRSMQRGLLYLNLSRCYIKNIDVEQLTDSIHQSTLKELNFSGNLFSYDIEFDKLNDLCESLINMLHLDLSYCSLESWPKKDIEGLIHSFKIMPNIISLDLYGNRYYDDIINLFESSSLRYLRLSLPAKAIDYIKAVDVSKQNDMIQILCSKINEIVNKNRPELLFIDFHPYMIY